MKISQEAYKLMIFLLIPKYLADKKETKTKLNKRLSITRDRISHVCVLRPQYSLEYFASTSTQVVKVINFSSFDQKWYKIHGNKTFSKIKDIKLKEYVKMQLCSMLSTTNCAPNFIQNTDTVDSLSLYLDYPLSRTSLYLKQKARSLGHLCTL